MSGATTRNPPSARAGTWWRHEYQKSGNPWRSTTRGPSPSSTKCNRTSDSSANEWVGLIARYLPRGGARTPRMNRPQMDVEPRMDMRKLTIVLTALLLALAACGPADEEEPSGSDAG